MQRVRITIEHDPRDPADDLRRAARVRRDLWAHSPVEIDPDSRAHGTHRDANRNAYFEFATDRLPEVKRVLEQFGHRAKAEVIEDAAGTECVNCGNLSPQLFTACPTCQFREIEPCPYCNSEVPRLAYLPVSGDLFTCPTCHHQVRLQFNDPMFDSHGQYIQPLIRVSAAEAPVNNGV